MAELLYLNQYFTTTLNVGGGIDDTQTTGIVITGVSGLDITKPGVALLSYTDPLNTANCEWIIYTSIDGSNELQGVTRGAEGFSAKSHSNGVTVAFPLSESHINRLADAVNNIRLSSSITSSATPTPTGSYDTNELYITALAASAELQEPSGTPANGNKLIVRIKDNGTARALTYNAIYSGIVDTLPSTTTISKVLYMGFIYNSTATKWEMVALAEEG